MSDVAGVRIRGRARRGIRRARGLCARARSPAAAEPRRGLRPHGDELGRPRGPLVQPVELGGPAAGRERARRRGRGDRLDRRDRPRAERRAGGRLRVRARSSRSGTSSPRRRSTQAEDEPRPLVRDRRRDRSRPTTSSPSSSTRRRRRTSPGYLAAGVSKTGVVATFGGGNQPPVTLFMDGFVDGVAKYNEVHGTDGARARVGQGEAGRRVHGRLRGHQQGQDADRGLHRPGRRRDPARRGPGRRGRRVRRPRARRRLGDLGRQRRLRDALARVPARAPHERAEEHAGRHGRRSSATCRTAPSRTSRTSARSRTAASRSRRTTTSRRSCRPSSTARSRGCDRRSSRASSSWTRRARPDRNPPFAPRSCHREIRRAPAQGSADLLI